LLVSSLIKLVQSRDEPSPWRNKVISSLIKLVQSRDEPSQWPNKVVSSLIKLVQSRDKLSQWSTKVISSLIKLVQSRDELSQWLNKVVSSLIKLVQSRDELSQWLNKYLESPFRHNPFSPAADCIRGGSAPEPKGGMTCQSVSRVCREPGGICAILRSEPFWIGVFGMSPGIRWQRR
jgi:hypothetical protein